MEKYTFNSSISIVLLLIVSLFSCRKEDKKNPISFTIKSSIPYDGTPIPGVKYTVREYKGGLNGIFSEPGYTDWELTGVTDANGLAQVNFNPKKNTKYQYEIAFDYSGIQLPAGINEVQLVNAPSFDKIPRQGFREKYDIRVLPSCFMRFKIENVNCFDSYDKMKFRTFNLSEFPDKNLIDVSWSNYFEGCGILIDYTGQNKVLTGRHIYEIEVIRNNLVTNYIDTFFLQPNIINDVFIDF